MDHRNTKLPLVPDLMALSVAIGITPSETACGLPPTGVVMRKTAVRRKVGKVKTAEPAFALESVIGIQKNFLVPALGCVALPQGLLLQRH